MAEDIYIQKVEVVNGIERSSHKKLSENTDTIESNSDFSSTGAGNGYLVADTTNGKTYRINTVNGVLTATEVV